MAERDGNRAGAQRLYRSALLMAEELGLWTEAVETLTWLGGTAPADGDAPEAAELYERALSLAAERAYGRGEARAEIGLGLAARLRGDRDAARRHLNRALAKSPSADHAAEAAAALAEPDLTPPGVTLSAAPAAADRRSAASPLGQRDSATEGSRFTVRTVPPHSSPTDVARCAPNAKTATAGPRTAVRRCRRFSHFLPAAAPSRTRVPAPARPAGTGNSGLPSTTE
ncbi:tetratricopeptide repeat protein [Streptomyces sp. NPDC049936]|uniref:tetratricopeptide repeat protein n=1 Tax=Streptomyces sp. NPDC049936 TaxID=3365599 RepID=UPI00378CEB0E